MRTLALCLLVLCACGSGTVISSGSYDQSCATDVDCTPVFQGDSCNVCGCPNTAINKAQVTRYETDLQSLRTKCGPTPAVACGPCQPQRGLCTGSKCSARPE